MTLRGIPAFERPQAPLREALLPRRRGLLRDRGDLSALAACRLGVDPGLEGRGIQGLEEEQQVAQVPLGIDREDGDPSAQHLLQEHDREAGLSRPRHAHDEPVGQEVGGIELETLAERALEVNLPAQVQIAARLRQAPPRAPCSIAVPSHEGEGGRLSPAGLGLIESRE